MLICDNVASNIHLSLGGGEPWEVCLHFRIVTRGAYPELVSLGCVDAFTVLAGSDLPPNFRWCVEVVTDNAIDAARLTGRSFQSSLIYLT